jgi:Zn-dependent protease
MRGSYSDYGSPPFAANPELPRGGVQFSRAELLQLGVAIFGLSAAFTVVLASPISGGGLDLFSGDLLANLTFEFLAAFLSVGTGVALHEIMHKVVAERYGYWAEFRVSLPGLAMTFVLAFLGVIFGAPGATYISGPVTPEQDSRISAAGPLTNIALGVLCLVGAVAVAPAAVDFIPFLIYVLFVIIASVNLSLAAFNMLPFGPLDGAKVWRWSKVSWLAIMVTALGVLALGVWQGYLYY